jgi:hypothetical protein
MQKGFFHLVHIGVVAKYRIGAAGWVGQGPALLRALAAGRIHVFHLVQRRSNNSYLHSTGMSFVISACIEQFLIIGTFCNAL